MLSHGSSTCLSDRPHDGRVSDPALHINGCLRASKRARFYNSLPPDAQERIARINNKTANLRHRLETTEQESTAGAALDRFKQSLLQWRHSTGRSHAYPNTHQTSAGADDPQDFLNYVPAPVMYFRNGHTPSKQKVTVADLLSDDVHRNPIMQPCNSEVIRYFHLPANNMSWVETVIARYYYETPLDSNIVVINARSKRPTTKTEMLLRPEYWQGQQNYEPDSEIHARHMRPFCSSISVNPTSAESTNIALFMPYLHWETDRGRVKSAQIVKEVGKDNISVSEVVRQARQQFAQSQTHTQDTLVPSISAPSPNPNVSVDRKRALAHMLTAAAALMEAIDLHTEELLMTKYLHAAPPMHPRRTLDQAYYGALRSTSSRDRDQVVYRATSAEPHDCIGMEVCPQCREDVRKTPRIIMVDQLWLWVLDENTVLTSFPRRWGRNRPDTSAIHQTLKHRLMYSNISTAYDLALVIVDEATRVFFDRAKLSQRQPNLTELFAAAIRDLTYKQTAAFDQFLIYTHLASRDYKRQRYGSSDNSTQNHLLNINPEGELLKEAKDIMDELHIMMRIKEQQQTVMENMIKHIRRRSETLPAHSSVVPGESLLTDHSSRISELQALLQNAQLTSAALKDLLTLKQQQASVIEAREAVKQAQLTLKQGQSIMIFTIVTIIFLPLSFFVGLFGMNSIEFNDGLLPLSKEFTYMFPISAGIILISFLFAFSQSVTTNSPVMLVRSAFSFAWNTAVTWLLIKTGMYVAGRDLAVKANRLRAKEAAITGGMKAEVLRKEKNLEKLKAAGHVREIMRRKTDLGGMMSPYAASGMLTPGTPGTPGPMMSVMMDRREGKGQGLGVGVGEVDVELGEMERKPSSQMYLVPGRGGSR
ncbi:magnesium transport protein cora [Podospora fimiseda]|uniref:Magnesium transport protein cora n=1 Tax=Podospora fimiseda TaxID=252190 RepID=A0AAN6YPJ6_9PEZI|nr:magnesium transport protein cora [Podospora fimiseda]